MRRGRNRKIQVAQRLLEPSLSVKGFSHQMQCIRIVRLLRQQSGIDLYRPNQVACSMEY